MPGKHAYIPKEVHVIDDVATLQVVADPLRLRLLEQLRREILRRTDTDGADVERARLLLWVLAYAGLSASWSLEDGDNPALALAVAEIAAAELIQEHGIHF